MAASLIPNANRTELDCAALADHDDQGGHGLRNERRRGEPESVRIAEARSQFVFRLATAPFPMIM
jgi:hypothetical protein